VNTEEFEEIKKRHKLDAFLFALKGSDEPVFAAAYVAHACRGRLIDEVDRLKNLLRNGMDTDWLD
jgi:hypothetical protein